MIMSENGNGASPAAETQTPNPWQAANTTQRLIFIASAALTLITGLYASVGAATGFYAVWALGLFSLICNAGALISYRVLLTDSGAKPLRLGWWYAHRKVNRS